jgi:hypothetical protein
MLHSHLLFFQIINRYSLKKHGGHTNILAAMLAFLCQRRAKIAGKQMAAYMSNAVTA